MNRDVLIHIDKVNFRYNREVVLEDITLDIEKGDFFGLIGPNGSGKTTLLKIILGILTPVKGEVTLFGYHLKSFNQWHKIGYVPQKAGSTTIQFPITVEEVVGMGLGDTDAVTYALKSVGMENFKKRLITEISGGEQQRVFIARALVSKPEILILDEPTVGVDIESQARFYELLQQLNQKHNLTLILVSHDIDVVAHEVKTVACLNHTLIYHGEPKEVLRGDVIEKLYGKNIRLLIHGH